MYRYVVASQLSHAAVEKEMANAVSDLRLEAEKAQWALETARANAGTAQEALERAGLALFTLFCK